MYIGKAVKETVFWIVIGILAGLFYTTIDHLIPYPSNAMELGFEYHWSFISRKCIMPCSIAAAFLGSSAFATYSAPSYPGFASTLFLIFAGSILIYLLMSAFGLLEVESKDLTETIRRRIFVIFVVSPIFCAALLSCFRNYSRTQEPPRDGS